MTDPAALYAQLAAKFKQGLWQEALALAKQLLPFAPEHAGVHSIAGVSCLELQQWPNAVVHLRRAAEIDPSRVDFAILYAKALLSNHAYGQARMEADRAMALTPQDPMALDTLGVIYVRTQAHQQAVAAFRQAVSFAPDSAARRLNLATALAATGHVDDAERELEICIRLDASTLHSHLLLAQLRQQTRDNNHLVRLQSLLAQHRGEAVASLSLNMALAKEHEDLGNYPEAFRHTVQGKSAGRSLRPYSSQQDKHLFATLMRAFPQTPAMASSGDPSDAPIFIIGMPRSGTTLVERILSSHPDVCAVGELQNFAAALQQESNNQQPYLLDPGMPQHIESIDWQQLGARYIASVGPETMRKPHFIDKMPHNFLYAGFIAHALPNAKIICVRRNPIDTCLANFRQLFAHPSIHLDYSFDLLDTGRYFILFDQLMAHWERLFPGRIHEVSYENLVDSQESCSRALVEYCGLSWDDACLHFEKNPSPVATLSSQQVRKPIFHSSVGRWKHYEQELTGLRKLLQDAKLIEAS
ncbi:MAG: sulfotransferase [Rhodanobacter sp.]